ncbi:hypothetical protein [Yoonia sp. SS1-5]|uniref:VPLPA-CTERM sorting domain-containing protein n=1 Tax=Yoonia rhodophyticola TaxID=3137370 RepID=A0AAN0MCV4_9RHOB
MSTFRASKAFFKAVVFSALALGSAANAATLDISHKLEVEYETVDGVRSNTATYSTDFHGSLVTATYVDGTTESMIWTQTSQWTAGINSDDIGLRYRWWGFDLTAHRGLASLSFDLAASGVIFDAGYHEGEVGNTPTTSSGIPVHLNAFNSWNTADSSLIGSVHATYSGLVQMVGHAPGMDAFTRLLIDFTGLEGGGFLGAVTLALDLDVLEGGSEGISNVPLPPALLLLLAAVGALGLLQVLQKREPELVPARA